MIEQTHQWVWRLCGAVVPLTLLQHFKRMRMPAFDDEEPPLGTCNADGTQIETHTQSGGNVDRTFAAKHMDSGSPGTEEEPECPKMSRMCEIASAALHDDGPPAALCSSPPVFKRPVCSSPPVFKRPLGSSPPVFKRPLCSSPLVFKPPCVHAVLFNPNAPLPLRPCHSDSFRLWRQHPRR